MIITLSGGNALLLQERLHQLTEDFIGQHGDLALERLDAGQTELQQLNEAVQALPFLSSRRLVIIDNPSANKNLSTDVSALLNAVEETTDLIFIEPKFDKRSVLYKTLKKSTSFEEYADLNESQLVTWAVKYASEQGGSLRSAEARTLVMQVGADQLRLKNELDKLMTFNPNITAQSIAALVVPTAQASTFDLLEATLGGNIHKAYELYDEQRRQRVESQAIVGLIAWQLHILVLVKTAADRSLDQVAKEAKLNPFVVRKSAALARSRTMTNIKALVAATIDLDRRLKRQGIDADEGMKNLLLVMSQKD